jgi:hypothetical protein
LAYGYAPKSHLKHSMFLMIGMPVKCALCSHEFRDARGLSRHVWTSHNVVWADYVKQHPVQRVEAPHEGASSGEGSKATLTPDQVALLEEIRKTVRNIITDPEMVDTLRKAMFPQGIPQAPQQKPTEAGLPEGVERLPEGAVRIGEEVEVVGEKVNYKVALNPEIFYFYSVFKAEAERRGRRWEGDFGDFLYMAAKDVLTTHGIHPAVVRLKEGQLILKVPMESE